MKTILALVLLGASLLVVATPLPAPGLLRVPRIYNALITSDEKLEPSRASPYSAPAYPVIGAPGFARVDAIPQQYAARNHDVGRKAHKNGGHSSDAEDPADIPAIGKNGEKIMPKAKMYPLTFHPRSVGYYPRVQPFLPYPYPYGAQPFYGGFPGVGFDSASTFSQIAGRGLGVASGVDQYSPYYTQGVGFARQQGGVAGGPFGVYPYGQAGQPLDFQAEQSSSVHMSAGSEAAAKERELEDEEEEIEEDEG